MDSNDIKEEHAVLHEKTAQLRFDTIRVYIL